MICNIAFNMPDDPSRPQVHQYAEITLNGNEQLQGFPLISFDLDSYLVGGQVQSKLDFAPVPGRHCIAVGKSCAMSEGITFMVNLDHDFTGVAQGDPEPLMELIRDNTRPKRTRQKGSIIIQNDVWVGHGATIMNGVTLHNGCVVGTNAMVTKDVPPYAIVGGNPARVLKYRFDPEIIDALQRIAWWDWPDEVLRERRMDFFLPPAEFTAKYLPLADNPPPPTDILPEAREAGREIVLFVPDVESKWPLYPSVLAEYFAKDRPHAELLLYLPEDLSKPEHLRSLEEALSQYEDRDSYVTLQTGTTLDERLLFQCADYYVTTRSRPTVARTCLADLYQAKILYGTDTQLFPECLGECRKGGV